MRNEDDDKNFETLVASEADKFVELQIDLSVEAFQAVTHLFFFTRILWRLSPTLGSAGLATAAFGTSFSLLFGGKALARSFREERKADGAFAHNLSRCRENIESIQFAKGLDFELSRIESLDRARLTATADRKRAKDVVALFSSLVRKLAGGVLPSIILRREHDEGNLHGHSHGQKDLHHHGHSHSHSHQQQQHLVPRPTHAGHPKADFDMDSEMISELAQATEAFDEILYHLLIVSENFHNTVRLVTIANDICGLLESEGANINSRLISDSPKSVGHIDIVEDLSEEWLRIDRLTVRVPRTDQLLIDDLNIKLKYGDTLLITGKSGCGKTALLRVLFGLWPAASGTVSRPSDLKLIVLPQKSFCSTGSLAEQVTYPRLAKDYSEDAIRDALKRVGLSHLLERHGLNAVEKWQEELSMGEVQRLGFARVVLHQPEFAFFDESTSSLDVESETKMYELVSEIIRGGFVSIGHRKSIERYHLHKIKLSGPQSAGKWAQEF